MTGANGLETAPVYAAAACAGAAVWMMAGREEGMRRARLLLAGGGEVQRTGAGRPLPWRELALRLRAWSGGSLGHAWWCLPLGVALGLLGHSWLPVVLGAVAVWPVRRWLRHRERRRGAVRREAAVVELCDAVAGELRAGRPPDRALLAVGAGALRELGDPGSAVLAAARFGGDVPEALRHAGALPGAEGLRMVAGCWQVSVERGAGLAEGLERIAATLREERALREEVEAQFAGPRATIAVLALLPAFGLLLGGAMGADPLEVLLHTPAGLACLVAGAALQGAGIAWALFLLRSASRRGG
ncbi:type II secretion system F family protein [Streptomyces sp. ODS28]|uniref:type II secretion system F family protein n=1 Tax=Streptomyces sp. ODS28 TaxID=3136688 RepID=UPI0031EE46DA